MIFTSFENKVNLTFLDEILADYIFAELITLNKYTCNIIDRDLGKFVLRVYNLSEQNITSLKQDLNTIYTKTLSLI